jgi:hypothetical protein
LLLGYANLPSVTAGRCRTELIESSDQVEDLAPPQLRILNFDGAVTETLYQQLPLLMMVETDLRVT